MATAYLSNDSAIVVEGLHDPWASSGAGADITTASSATAQVYETDRTTTVGGSITLTNYTSRDGVTGNWWVGVLEEDHAAIVAEGAYTVKVDITASSDRVFSAWVDFNVVRRRS